MKKRGDISIEDLAEPLTYPVEAFLSPEYAKAERDLLWPKVWQMAGRLEDISHHWQQYHRLMIHWQNAPIAV